MDKAPEQKRIFLPIQQAVYDRYTQFWKTLEGLAAPGMNNEEVGEKMRTDFGDTYWWYNIFGRKMFIVQRKIDNELPS